MRIEVINVGDGACSAVSCYCQANDLTLVDCGTHSRSEVLTGPEVAAAQQLGGRLANLTTMVVTHFDVDHWGGLCDLVAPYRRRQRDSTRRIALFYPGMPVGWATADGARGDDLMVAMVALTRFLSQRAGDPVDVIALKNAWRGAAEVVHEPLYRGATFRANGHDWLVHWPPRSIDAVRGRRYEKWLNEIKNLAVAMANDPEDPNPTLRDQLRRAYVQWHAFRAEEIRAAALSGDQANLYDDWGLDDFDDSERETHEDEQEQVYPDDMASHVATDDAESTQALNRLPEKYRGKLRELIKGLKGIDNYFSLVVSLHDDFISFGDIEGSALGDLLNRSATSFPRLEEIYRVMLPPHHGSHSRHSSRLPDAVVCISQNGSWLEGHNSRHRHGHRCNGASTWEDGTLVFDDGFFHRAVPSSLTVSPTKGGSHFD